MCDRAWLAQFLEDGYKEGADILLHLSCISKKFPSIFLGMLESHEISCAYMNLDAKKFSKLLNYYYENGSIQEVAFGLDPNPRTDEDYEKISWICELVTRKYEQLYENKK